MTSPTGPDDAHISSIRGIMADQLRIDPELLTDHLTLEELGLDSMALTETLAAVEERYGVRMDGSRLAERITPVLPVGDLLDSIARMLSLALDTAATGS